MSNLNSPERLEGRRLAVARAAWIGVVALNLALLIAAIPVELEAHFQLARHLYEPALVQAGSSARFYAIFCTALDVTLVLAFTVVGIVMFWRRSDERMVLLTSLSCITFATLFVPTLVMLMQSAHGWAVPVGLVRAVGLASSLVVPYYLFPTGRFVPGWARWPARAWVALTALWFVAPAAPANLVYIDTYIQNLARGLGVYLFAYATGVAAQIYRYARVSSAVERQQTRWVVFGTTAAFLGVCLYNLPKVLYPAVDQPGALYVFYIFYCRPLYYLLVALAPLCIAISILRYRLWNIDVLIRRTLNYGIVTGALVLFYAGSVLLLQQVFRPLLPRSSALAVVTSTLGIATLFQPLRRRVQEAIDSRFYRRKYDANQVLAQFSSAARDQVDLDALTAQLLSAVQETVQPEYAGVWLKTIALESEGRRQRG